MGLHIGAGGSNVKLLYEDETYSVWDEKTSAYILLVIKPWHLNIGFYYDEWKQLRKVVADIELSQASGTDPAVLYVDSSATVFYFDAEYDIDDYELVKDVSDHYPVYGVFRTDLPDDDG